MKVQDKQTGNIIDIKEARFNPELHEIIQEGEIITQPVNEETNNEVQAVVEQTEAPKPKRKRRTRAEMALQSQAE